MNAPDDGDDDGGPLDPFPPLPLEMVLTQHQYRVELARLANQRARFRRMRAGERRRIQRGTQKRRRFT